MSLQPTTVTPRQRTIQWLMYTSILLSLVIFGIDASQTFSTAFYAAPAPIVLSIVHHITILVMFFKEQRQSHITGSLPVMAKLGTTICIWLLMFLWLAIGGLVAFQIDYNLHAFDVGPQYRKPNEFTIAFFTFVVIEFIVILAITILTTVERTILLKGASQTHLGDVEK